MEIFQTAALTTWHVFDFPSQLWFSTFKIPRLKPDAHNEGVRVLGKRFHF